MTNNDPRLVLHYTWFTNDSRDMMLQRRRGLLGSYLRDILRSEVRERLGAAYSPVAYHTADMNVHGLGQLHLQVSTDEENKAAVQDLIQSVVATLQNGQIDAERLLRVREPLMKQIIAYRQSNRYWLQGVLSDISWRPERLAWAQTMEADYQGITAAELSELAQEIFSQPAVRYEAQSGPDL